MDGFSLANRTALVTGSSRGIGRAIALGLARQGAAVAIHGAGDAAEAEAVAAEVVAAGGRACALQADFADPASCRFLAAQADEALGGIDILVLNASYEARAAWTEIDAAMFDLHVAVNLQAPLLLLQQIVPPMVRRGWGRVVTIGSIQEAKPNPQLLLYAALKSAQTNMAFNLARQVGGQGVTVNAIAPGAIATARNEAVLADPAYRARVEAQIPAGRIGTPQDCVGACLLLCSEAGSYINGAVLPVDGGWHLG